MQIFKEVTNHVKKSNIAKAILKMDRALEVEDLIQDVYLLVYNKDIKYIHNCIKLSLIDIYRAKKSRFKHYVSLELLDQSINNSEDVIVAKTLLDTLEDLDKEIHTYMYKCYIENKTFQDIADEENKTRDYVRSKIRKGLKLLSEL